jgi:LPS sulfotransferase NodH
MGGMPGRLLFIVGTARSGSTLLRQMMNRSSLISIAPETHFMRRARRLRIAERLRAGSDGADLERLCRELYRVDEESRTGYWAWIRRNVSREELLLVLRESDGSIASLFRRLIERWAEARGSGSVLIGEKSPEHLRDVPTLARWYPESVFVHTLRDPRAVYVSELRRRREGRWGLKRAGVPLPQPLVDAALGPIQLLHTLVNWRQAVALDLRYRRTLGDRYLLLRFEDLVREPEAELRSLCDRLGVAFDPAMLEVDVVGSSFQSDRHAGAGLDPSAIDRWRQHVGRLSRAWFALTLGGPMARHGYR